MGAVIQPFQEAYPVYFSGIYALDAGSFGVENAWNHVQFERVLDLKDELSFCAVKDNKVVGYLIGSRYFMQHSGVAHINRIAVDALYRNLHLGQLLVEYFERAAKLLDIRFLTLEFDQMLRVDTFYKKFGFEQVTGEEEIMDYLTGKDKVHVMERYLSFSRKIYIKRL